MQTQHWTQGLMLIAGLMIVGGGGGPGAGGRLLAQTLPAPQPAAAALHPGERVIRLVRPHSELTLTELHSRVVELDARIRLVDDFNQQIVSVTALSPHQLRVRAESPGVTSLRITDEFDNVFTLEVLVERDLRELQSHIKRLFPGSSIEVIGVRDSIVLRGWVTQPSQIPQIVKLASTYSADVQNHIEIGGGNLVQLSVRVMEVQRSKLEQFGFNFLALGQNYYYASTPGALVPVTGATLPFGGPPTVTVQQTALANAQQQFAILGSSDIFEGFIEALKQESLLKIMAEPKVATTSGRPAEIHSGGEFPILVPQGVGTTSIQFRQFGIRLEAVPLVLSEGRVQLDLAAEVSERDFSNSVDIGGIRVPALTSRNVNTRVEMDFGQTLMIGGLTQDRLTVSTNKVPFLGDIPYLGAAFSRKNHQLSTTELVIMVTPNLIAPLGPGQVPCSAPGLNSDRPTTGELLFNGHVEVPRFSGAYPGGPPGMICPDACPGGGVGPHFSDTPIPLEGSQFAAPPGPAGQDASTIPRFFPAPAEGVELGPSGEPGLQPGDPFGSPGDSGNSAPALPPLPAASQAPAGHSHYRQQTGIRRVEAVDADLSPSQQRSNTGRPVPGLIEPRPAATRPTPQFIGRSSVP